MSNESWSDESCYHCGLPVLKSVHFSAHVLGQSRAMCCKGCQTVAESIVDNGLEDYYAHRTELPQTPEDLIPSALKELTLYDHPEVQKSFVSDALATSKQAMLILEGITCAACIWLNERHLTQLGGVHSVMINYATHRMRLVWDDDQIKLSHILAEIRKLGYRAYPYSAQQQDVLRTKQRKQDIKRIAVAALCAAQVMMIAVALYAGPAQGLETATAQLLRWLSLVLSIPAMTYAAAPFYLGAWRSLSSRMIGMDVPIVLGLLTGFAGSVYVTLQGQGGHVYFDTLTMLIVFLLTTRYLERNARERSVEAAENLLRLVPAMVSKLDHTQQPQLVPLAEVNVDDLLLVKPGDTIATDGLVIDGQSSTDESLLTGESKPIIKGIGAKVYAGTVNYESPLTIRVTDTGDATMLASITRLLDRALAEKPKLAQLADHVASYFTLGLLLFVAAVAYYWWVHDASRMLEIILSVLVVSCPCALSLAAPAAFAAAGAHLVKRGLLLTRGHALETLARVTHIVFDKTGTLTVGRPQLVSIVPLQTCSEESCLALAASLEQHSEHPIAQSILQAAKGLSIPVAQQVNNLAGQGVHGEIDGVYYQIGNQPKSLHAPPIDIEQGATLVYLSDNTQDLACFVFTDMLRPQTPELLLQLRQQGLSLRMLSGDSVEAVSHIAAQLQLADWRAALSPTQKLAEIQTMQAQGAVVAMVGDGINDAPVLAGANVSIAMGGGTQIARTSGDAVLLTDQLTEIAHAVTTARFGLTIIRQNFAWALVYNAIALPFAAMGVLSPLMAAIGMSVSSLVVVLNALRLK